MCPVIFIDDSVDYEEDAIGTKDLHLDSRSERMPPLGNLGYSDLEYVQCIGGLRAPWRPVHKIQNAKKTGEVTMSIISRHIAKDSNPLKAADAVPSFTGSPEVQLRAMR